MEEPGYAESDLQMYGKIVQKQVERVRPGFFVCRLCLQVNGP